MTDPRERIIDRLIDALAMCYKAKRAGHSIVLIADLEKYINAMYREWVKSE